MELDLEGLLADRAYPILASFVVPRPIALVTTIGLEGEIEFVEKNLSRLRTSQNRRT